MDFDEETFTAFLVHPDRPALDRAMELPLLEPVPPVRVRIPAQTEGEATEVDVYELVAADDWPREVMYRHIGREPRHH